MKIEIDTKKIWDKLDKFVYGWVLGITLTTLIWVLVLINN